MSPTERLRVLSRTPDAAMDLGKAAEHLVVADLLMSGYRAFLSDQGLPYDVLVDLSGRIIRLQVKATAFPRNVNSQGRNPRLAYSWSARRRGKLGYGRLEVEHADIIALVALDIRQIAYLPVLACGQTVQLTPPGQPADTAIRGTPWEAGVDGFPFDMALAGDLAAYEAKKRRLETCKWGHPRNEENLHIDVRGSLTCRVCARERKKKNRSVSISCEADSVI